MTPEAILEKLITSEDIKAEWFAPDFLAAVPINQIQTTIVDLKNQLGAYQKVEQDGNDYVVNFSQGSVATKITLNSEGQIIGLL
ncbi:MAG: serine hydrolase, partial [Cyanobacteria bacterium P01_D01_bin.116]